MNNPTETTTTTIKPSTTNENLAKTLAKLLDIGITNKENKEKIIRTLMAMGKALDHDTQKITASISFANSTEYLTWIALMETHVIELGEMNSFRIDRSNYCPNLWRALDNK